MINADMRSYEYFTFGESNAYGQPQLSQTAQGTIKIAIYISSQSVQDNINYENCNFVGITTAPIDDSYVIQYGTKKLKVLYVNAGGRYTQVYLQEI